jgi:hypothetical protein
MGGTNMNIQIKMASMILMVAVFVLPSVTASIMKIYPTDDAFVRTGSALPHGDSDLRVGFEASHGTDRSFLRFDLSELPEEFSSAIFSIEPNANQQDPVINLHLVSSNSWQEETLIYSNAPTIGNIIGTSSVIINNDRINFDVEAYLTGEAVSFALKEQGENGFVQFFSKEYFSTGLEEDQIRWPYLEIEYEGEEPPVCETDADLDCGGCIGLTEYNDFKYGFKNGLYPGTSLLDYNDIKYGFKNSLLNTC